MRLLCLVSSPAAREQKGGWLFKELLQGRSLRYPAWPRQALPSSLTSTASPLTCRCPSNYSRSLMHSPTHPHMIHTKARTDQRAIAPTSWNFFHSFFSFFVFCSASSCRLVNLTSPASAASSSSAILRSFSSSCCRLQATGRAVAQAAGEVSVHHRSTAAQAPQQQTGTGGRQGLGSPQEQHGTGGWWGLGSLQEEHGTGNTTADEHRRQAGVWLTTGATWHRLAQRTRAATQVRQGK